MATGSSPSTCRRSVATCASRSSSSTASRRLVRLPSRRRPARRRAPRASRRHARIRPVGQAGHRLPDRRWLTSSPPTRGERRDEAALLTHDLGDTVGGELLARQIEGRWPVAITRRVLTNGSIYIEMAHLSVASNCCSAFPTNGSARPPSRGRRGRRRGGDVRRTGHVADDDIAGHAELVTQPRRSSTAPPPRPVYRGAAAPRDAVHRRHRAPPLPCHRRVGNRDDPIAVAAMATRLHRARPDATLTWLDGVGHYPMLEDPDRFAGAVVDGLD